MVCPLLISFLLTSLHVAWEGTFLDLGSLSHVNRELTRELKQMPDLDVSCIAIEKRGDPPVDAQVTVRHAWPPNWQRPQGKWVLMQPWEFGALPEEWVHRAKEVDEIWANTQFVKQEYVDSGVDPEKIVIIPLGIDPEKFHPKIKPLPLQTKKKFKFLFLGGTIYRKGPDLLLNSYLNTFTAADDVCLVIKDFGNTSWYAGQTHERLIRAAQQIPQAAEILYLDQEMSDEEIAALYTACDCFVAPYRGEGFGLPVLEAMASGLPVIVTKGGSTDDFVTDQFGWFIPSKVAFFGTHLGHIKLVKEGWLLEPNREELSRLLRWAFEHPEEGKYKGSVASDHVRKQWTWKRSASLVAARLRTIAKK